MPQPRELTLFGLRFADVRHFWPLEGSAARERSFDNAAGVAIHHDAVIMEPGDRDFNGSTLDEDLERIEAIHRHSIDQDWGTFPYHFMASPNGRLFYCLDVRYFGAHVARRNHELLGISLMGDFTSRQPANPQLCATGQAVVVILRSLPHLVPVKGHREWALPDSPTACPGDTWWQWQNRLWASIGVAARNSTPR